MAFDLGRPGARFVRHFQPVHGRQLFDGFDKLESVVIHQKVDGVAVRTTPKTVIKLLFAINGKGRRLFVVERTARVVVLALLLELHAGVDQIDDVGASQQVIDKYARNSSSHKPLLH